MIFPFPTIQKDLYRILGCKKNRIGILLNLYNPEFVFLFYLRCANYHYKKKNRLKFLFFKFFWRHYSIKYGYEIHYKCEIAPGLKLVHRGGVVVNSSAKIGHNVTLQKGCTIGSNRRGKKCGVPSIGDNVWIGANAAIIGKVTIGDDVMIAPNSYINFDVPSHSVCVGNPAKIIPRENATEFYNENPI